MRDAIIALLCFPIWMALAVALAPLFGGLYVAMKLFGVGQRYVEDLA